MHGRAAVTAAALSLGCGGDGPDHSATLSSPTLSASFTSAASDGASDDGPDDGTAPAQTDPDVATSTNTSTSESGDVSTGPVGEPNQVVIDFDEWGMTQPVITDQYAAAIFASEDACAAIAAVGAKLANTSTPNVLWVSSKTDGSCLSYADLHVDFPSPAYGLAFNAALVESTGVAARVRVYQLGVETALIDIVGIGDTSTPIPVDLSLYPGITRIDLVDTEEASVPGGIKYDDFTFTVYL